MTPLALKYHVIAVVIAVAQPSLQVASAYGSTGKCIVDPQPGYNFTALQICTTGPTSVVTNGSLSQAFLISGSDPLAAGQPNIGDDWVNYLRYAEYDDHQDITQFFPVGYDVDTCAEFACLDGQPCAPWGNGGNKGWWTSTRETNYGGYMLLDYINTDPPVLNLRDTGLTWFICTPATRDPCTDGDGTVVRYLYDCRPNFTGEGAKLIPPPFDSGSINWSGDSVDCGYGSAADNAGSIDLFWQAVSIYMDDATIALPGQPIYCNAPSEANAPNEVNLNLNDYGGLCVYYQGTATGNGTLTKSLMTQLYDVYGYWDCGNIPVQYPEVNWLAFGYLTVGVPPILCDPCTLIEIPGAAEADLFPCACPGFLE